MWSDNLDLVRNNSAPYNTWLTSGFSVISKHFFFILTGENRALKVKCTISAGQIGK